MKDSEIILVLEEAWFNNSFKLREETAYEVFKHTGWI
jgi:hypothetical protein